MANFSENFLASCLLEAIEDEHYNNTKKLVLIHKANTNKIIDNRGIAPIHYAAGMDNVDFSEYVMKIFMKNNGDPNVQTDDGETPLHIAASWNRKLIVEMLLDHGADVSIEDNDGHTAINYAILEGHQDIVDVFKRHVFEKKLEEKSSVKASVKATPTKEMQPAIKTSRFLEVPSPVSLLRDNLIYTPNRGNYNFDATSPYYINITHRRKKEDKPPSNTLLSRTISYDPLIGDSNADNLTEENDTKINKTEEESPESGTFSGDNQTVILRENLFKMTLTEGNLKKHLDSFSKVNRASLVHSWRKKVHQPKNRKSILPANESELDSFIANHCKRLESGKTSTPVQNNGNGVIDLTETDNEFLDAEHENDATESFVTAEEQERSPNSGNNLSISFDEAKKLMKSPNKREEIVLQVENYLHTDNESDVIFFETKLLRNPLPLSVNRKLNDSTTTIDSNPSTEVTIPLEYDTDDLRRELTLYGEPPGPITKSTKRLYLKKLIKYKRRSENYISNMENERAKNHRKFSVELEKTLRLDNKNSWQDIIFEHKTLEAKMSDGFQNCNVKKFREGNLKKSFIYLLIDPRISENLPGESQLISKHEAWRRFIMSIFYVGKGKSSRPYAHLYDAIKIYQDNPIDNENRTKHYESVKLDRIIDIWKANKGVVCLPVFHNIIPVEAYTREAAIIDSIGLQNLSNLKRGDYYGLSLSWTMRQRKQLGVLLLYKAMHIFFAEGESQLRPDDIKILN